MKLSCEIESGMHTLNPSDHAPESDEHLQSGLLQHEWTFNKV